MKKVWRVALLMVLAMMLANGCAPDPRMAADAEATRLKAAEQAADAQAARAQREAEDAIILAEKQAASRQWVESWNNFVRWTMVVLTFAASILMLGAAFGGSWAIVGAGRAFSQMSWVRANSISLDRETRQYPVYLQHVGNGLFTLTNINTGMVSRLDVRSAADRQLIATVGAVQLSGAVAYQARMAEEPAGVAILGTRPVVVGAQDNGLQVGDFSTSIEESNHAAD